MTEIEIEITGNSPMLHHKMPDEDLFKLLGAKQEKKKSQEELTPREIAERHVYKTGEHYIIPMEMVVGAIKHVASDYKQKNTARKSLKTVAAGAIRPGQDAAVMLGEDGNPLASFEVDVRKATNHQKGAIAVCRPRFDKWKARFKLNIDETIITTKVAQEMLEDAGKRAGIGSFRVARGGYFGQFRVTEWKEL